MQQARENLEQVSGVLTQKLAQQASIRRLLEASQAQLEREADARMQAEQDIEFAALPEEKAMAESQLRAIAGRISEINAAIRHRKKTDKKIAAEIANYTSSKSRISARIGKKAGTTPASRRSAAGGRHKRAAPKARRKTTRKTPSRKRAAPKARRKTTRKTPSRKRAAPKARRKVKSRGSRRASRR